MNKLRQRNVLRPRSVRGSRQWRATIDLTDQLWSKIGCAYRNAHTEEQFVGNMATVYRGMMMKDGLPEVGRSAMKLGVRVLQTSGKNDIPVSSSNMVRPEKGGMSVNSSVDDIPEHRKTEEFGGSEDNPNFRMFKCDEAAFSGGLYLRRGRSHHLDEPLAQCLLQEYEMNLSNTRHKWIVL